jgi:hypothetical protein
MWMDRGFADKGWETHIQNTFGFLVGIAKRLDRAQVFELLPEKNAFWDESQQPLEQALGRLERTKPRLMLWGTTHKVLRALHPTFKQCPFAYDFL